MGTKWECEQRYQYIQFKWWVEENCYNTKEKNEKQATHKLLHILSKYSKLLFVDIKSGWISKPLKIVSLDNLGKIWQVILFKSVKRMKLQ